MTANDSTAERLYRSGDLVGFSADGPLSFGINLATCGWPMQPRKWRGLSHVAIVARDPIADQLVLWESTSLYRRPCIHCEEVHGGVQSHWIGSRVLTYGGAVWHYRLRQPLDEEQDFQLAYYLQGEHGKTYDNLGAFRSRETPLSLLERCFARRPEDLTSIFCSELIAAAWRHVGRWNPPDASRWSPNRLARTALAIGLVDEPRRVR